MMDSVNVSTQAELERIVAEGNIPVVTAGFYRVTTGTVRAYGQSTVEADGQSTVRAGKFVPVQRVSEHTTVTGGVLIEIPKIETLDDFLDYYGLEPDDGYVVMYKAVNEEWQSQHGARYEPGTETTCDDFDPAPCCGYGLHFRPRPWLARRYSDGPRFVACRLKIEDIVVITDRPGHADKVKAPACTVLHEVDVDGEQIATEAATA